MSQITRRTAVVELSDGSVKSVRIINPDVIRYEETAQRHGWPGLVIEDGKAEYHGTALRSTFEAWAAMKRTGQYPGSWEQFRDGDCVDVQIDEEEVVPPTPLAPADDSSPSSPGTDAGPSLSSVTPTTS